MITITTVSHAGSEGPRERRGSQEKKTNKKLGVQAARVAEGGVVDDAFGGARGHEELAILVRVVW